MLIIGLAGLAILLALGNWQLRRLVWKEGILAEIEARIYAEPVALPAQPDPEADKYLPVLLSGRIETGELHVLSATRDDGAGYRIIAPMLLEDGRRVLLDRGFVDDLDKDAPRQTGPADVTGNLLWPDDRDAYTPEPDLGRNIWFSRKAEPMAEALNTEPVLVVARTPTDPNILPIPVGTDHIKNDHMQYALTWFSLALVWAAMTAYFLWRTRAKPEG